MKGVTLHRGSGVAEWPDCVSARGAAHLRELARVAAAGDRAVVLFVVQRADCSTFKIAADLDPTFAREMETAKLAGVEVLAYGCEVSPEGQRLARRLA